MNLNHTNQAREPRRTPVRFVIGWAMAGGAAVWFARTTLTVPTTVCVAGVLAVAVAAAAYLAGWVARGRTNGR